MANTGSKHENEHTYSPPPYKCTIHRHLCAQTGAHTDSLHSWSVQFLRLITAPCSLPSASPHLHPSPMGPTDRQQTGNPDSVLLTCSPITHSTGLSLASFSGSQPAGSPLPHTVSPCLIFPSPPQPCLPLSTTSVVPPGKRTPSHQRKH